ncbi:MAG: formylglycine-generating enzyme family protein [Candidatus Cloacimonetes bacterium]|nr:formylglycine-generating enzyme family protein [Candidatus Cloacimonadota bacterium]
MKFIILGLMLSHIIYAGDSFFEGLVQPKDAVRSNSSLEVDMDQLYPFIAVESGSFYMGTHPRYEKSVNTHTRKIRMVSWSAKSGRKIWSEFYTPKLRVKTVINQGFELGKYEVTQEFFEKVMSYNPSRFKGAKRPVENLSRSEIDAFLKKLNQLNDGYLYKLPSQVQWEYAYRARESHTFFFKNQTNYKEYMNVDLNKYPMIGLAVFGWLEGNTSRQKILVKQGGQHLSQHQEIGLKPANAWGFHDMVGNVGERTSSVFSLPKGVHWLDSKGQKLDSSNRGKIAMGGSFKDMASINSRLDFTFAAYPGSRVSLYDHSKMSNMGFRLMRQPIN